MYAVLGANGRAGGETAKALIAQGNAVRVILRRSDHDGKWKRLGAEVAIADIDDAASLTAALRGVDGAFLLNPPPVSGDPFERTQKVGTAISRAARDAGVPKIVLLSSIGAQHVDGTGVIATLNRIEALLEGAAPAITVLRPGYFIDTWSEVLPAVVAEGILPSCMEPTQKIPTVSTIDVGRAAARLLGDRHNGNRIVELRGPRDWCADDVAAAFAAVLGKPVSTVFVPREERAAMYDGEGVPVEIAQALIGMYDGIAAGIVEHDMLAEEHRGTVELKEAIRRMVEARPVTA